MQQHFRVGGRAEARAVGLEFRAQLRIVVDLAVEHDDEPAVVTHHRLRSSVGEIDDREPSMPQAATPVPAPPHARSIGASCTHRLSRLQKLGFLRRAGRRVIRKNAVYAAHAK